MDDLTMTRLCAEAMGYKLDDSEFNGGGRGNTGFDMLGRAVLDWHNGVTFDPLHDDAQCMALVKRCELSIDHTPPNVYGWVIRLPSTPLERMDAYGPDLNRAIVECVARLHQSKEPRK